MYISKENKKVQCPAINIKIKQIKPLIAKRKRFHIFLRRFTIHLKRHMFINVL